MQEAGQVKKRDAKTEEWFDVDSVQVHIEDGLKKFLDIHDFFSNEQLIGFSGALRGSTLRVSPFVAKDGTSLEAIRLSVEHHAVVGMVRLINLTPDRGTVLTNATFRVRAAHRGNRLGARALAIQVQAAEQHGFDAIELDALGSYAESIVKHWDDRLIGYWLWPRLGFDAPIPGHVRSKLSPQFRGCTFLSELMATEEGVREWQVYGDSLYAARFDLSEESASRKLLLRYLNTHGIEL